MCSELGLACCPFLFHCCDLSWVQLHVCKYELNIGLTQERDYMDYMDYQVSIKGPGGALWS